MTADDTDLAAMHAEICMTANPFDDEDGVFHVLKNDEGQHSLWPAHVRAPDGWHVVHRNDTRAACLAYVTANWTDMRPVSLIKLMEQRPE